MKKISHGNQRNALPKDQLPELDADEATPPPKATVKQLQKITELARDQVRLQRAVEKKKKELKEAEQKLQANKVTLLPKAMDEAHEVGMPLGGGATLDLETIVTASVPSPFSDRAENAEERNRVGIQYLNKYAPSLPKHKATIFFERGQEKELRKLLANLGRYNPPMEVQVESTVHSSTLGKWVKEQDKLGKSVDEKALNVHRIRVATVTLPKKKKDSI